MTSRQWRPIAPLVPQPNRDFSANDDLRQQWLSQRSNVEHTSLTALHRSWAIETGIIKGIYQLDEAQKQGRLTPKEYQDWFDNNQQPEWIKWRNQASKSQAPKPLATIIEEYVTERAKIQNPAPSTSGVDISLTHEMNDPDSPVSVHMKERFPNTLPIMRAANERLRDAPTLQPSPQVPYPLIGTAVDYRIRYLFPNPEPVQNTAAWEGLIVLNAWANQWQQDSVIYGQVPGAGPGHFSMDALAELLDSTNQLLANLSPAGRTLPNESEIKLSRQCLALAMLEQCARAHPQRNTLLHSQNIHHPQDALALMDDTWTQDVASMTPLALQALGNRINKPHRPNPGFAGSADVGGADGDLLLEDCPIDIKTTIHPRVDAKWLPNGCTSCWAAACWTTTTSTRSAPSASCCPGRAQSSSGSSRRSCARCRGDKHTRFRRNAQRSKRP